MFASLNVLWMICSSFSIFFFKLFVAFISIAIFKFMFICFIFLFAISDFCWFCCVKIFRFNDWICMEKTTTLFESLTKKKEKKTQENRCSCVLLNSRRNNHWCVVSGYRKWMRTVCLIFHTVRIQFNSIDSQIRAQLLYN